VPSARTVAASLALAAVPALLSGCDSTQNQSARAKLVADRLLAARTLPRAGHAPPHVRVLRTELVRGRHGAALAVTVRNAGPASVTDVPVLAGLRSRGDLVSWANRRRGDDFFASHVPIVAPGGTTTWVWTSSRVLPSGSAPVARLGRAAGATRVPAGTPPRLVARALRRRGGHVVARVENVSHVPQYGLQLYATERRGGRLEAAGRAQLTHLGTGRSADVPLTLVGRPGRGVLRLDAVPTIFR
jgi:hypothetical protein